jgi:hypothetical protein
MSAKVPPMKEWKKPCKGLSSPIRRTVRDSMSMMIFAMRKVGKSR